MIKTVDSVSFEVCKEEILDVLWANGEGKTTTIKMFFSLTKALV